MNVNEQQEALKLIALFNTAGYIKCQKITNTLQGSIWRCFSVLLKKNVVIKVTSRSLHNKSVIVINGSRYKVEENIIKEKSILKYLTKDTKCPDSIVKYIDCLKSNTNYYLVMEDGGHSLFSFIEKVHKIILAGNMDITSWHETVKIIFKQMIECIQYIHSKYVCHYDISLENFVINDVDVYYGENGKLRLCNDSIQIKLCDFGLAGRFKKPTLNRKRISEQDGECMNNNIDNIDNTEGKRDDNDNDREKSDFLSQKWCGKPNYKSPEVTSQKRSFNAKSNDIFCVGVCLFMMLIGSAPWRQTHKTDKTFMKIMNGQIKILLTKWKRIHYINDNQLQLISSILQYQDKRINMQQIINSQWIKQ